MNQPSMYVKYTSSSHGIPYGYMYSYDPKRAAAWTPRDADATHHIDRLAVGAL